MKIEQKNYTQKNGWQNMITNNLKQAQLVLVFGSTALLKKKNLYNKIKSFYPSAHILLSSTAGEILGTKVYDNTLAVTAIKFEKTKLEFAETTIKTANESNSAGRKLASSLKKKGLVHVMVFSEGLKVNGTALVVGLLEKLPKNVSVTGGLVGDGARFKETLVGLDKAPKSGKLVLIGFYGKSLKVGYGSLGGWNKFGIERTITNSKGNVLFELDDKPALKLYKKYLGKQAKGLPGTGLLFPLSLKMKSKLGTEEVVRTILAVDEKKQSMTFAGDMPKGTKATLMKANFERLIDGAGGAALKSKKSGSKKIELAILISCIGRKLVLKERIEDEVEAVQNVLGEKAILTGFYSYGEICPTIATSKQSQLHNQTMTITTFRE